MRRHIALALLLVLIVGCRDASPSLPPEPQPAQSTKATPTPADPPAPHKPEGIGGDVAITFEVERLPGRKVRLVGSTNLPEGTHLGLGVWHRTRRDFFMQSSLTVPEGGRFTSEVFGPKSGLIDGPYRATVTMPVVDLQPESIRRIIGQKGETLTGPLVERGRYGVTASATVEFEVGPSD